MGAGIAYVAAALSLVRKLLRVVAMPLAIRK